MTRTRSVGLILLAALLAGGLLHWSRSTVAPATSGSLADEGTRESRSRTATPSSAVDKAHLLSQVVQAKPVFTFVKAPDCTPALEANLPKGAHDIRYVQVDAAFINGKESPLWKPAGQGVYALPLGDGRTVQVRVVTSEMLDAQRFSSLGEIEGQPGSMVVFTGGLEGQYSMEITEALSPEQAPDGVAGPRRHALNPTGGEVMQLVTLDTTQAPPCGATTDLQPTEAMKASKQRRGTLVSAAQAPASTTVPTGENTPLAAATATSSPVQIDVMFLYTQAVMDSIALGSPANKIAAIRTRVDTIVTSTNAAYTRSLVNQKIRSVLVEFVDFDEMQSTMTGGTVNSVALDELWDDTDGVIDGVHARRDAVAADLVCLMLNRYDSSNIGLAPILGSPTVLSTLGAQFNDFYAFSVVTYGYTNGYDLVAHELGHNMGAQHDRDNAKGYDDKGNLISVDGAFPYSYGYRFSGIYGGTYHTIMAYAPGAGVSYFSNPNVVASESYLQVKVGSDENLPNPCYNTKTLNQTCFEVAQYRHQNTDPVAAGTMVNVSTLGFVGAGDQQMTAGFSIEGTGSKEVLIRAIGPSLSQFSVPNLLTDPWIELTDVTNGSALRVVGSNDDWGTAANAARITQSAADLGAFAITSPKDAAMVVSLTPGNYTAKVEGVGGLTGMGITEVYETTSGGTARLVNVSTRAYADASKEMTGGFVITGTPGTTKRVLVRAQGPNLANYNVAGVMNDPYLRLFRAGANTQLLMANDDWTASKGQIDDAHPTATYYDELAIAATGFAPKNRREPCILVDLEPGMYTVIVTPFVDSNGVQPVQPGVAIVEVFEITK